ncbi:hypothetical protein [Bradyrhizobium guangzhouense]|uniref:hypothetical protein n=1 Tax=Bradyrhizobium guangzhouense TaxID=1325095 RepID=UPI001009ECEA|nr:hypothetical protein [Bradyrhizobium guangzhouense]
MNRIASICCTIRKAAEHVTGPEGYSMTSLYEVLDELSNAQDRVMATIAKREKVFAQVAQKPGFVGLLDFLAPNNGGAA